MLVILISLLMLINPQKIELLSEARKMFFEFETNKNAPEQLFKMLSEEDLSKNPKLLAYKGVSRASSADAAFNPATKLSRFNEGKKMIEESIKLSSGDAELRFLRLSVQKGAPVFLNYRSNIEEDRSYIIESLSSNIDLFKDKAFTKKVLIFLHDRSNPNEKQLVILKNLMLKYS
jgi:organic radical activating enzyme